MSLRGETGETTPPVRNRGTGGGGEGGTSGWVGAHSPSAVDRTLSLKNELLLVCLQSTRMMRTLLLYVYASWKSCLGSTWELTRKCRAPGSFPDLLDLKVYFDNLSRRSVCTKKLGKDAGRRPLGLLFLASHHIQIYVRKESKIHWRNIRSKLNWNLRPTQLKNLPLGPLVQ